MKKIIVLSFICTAGIIACSKKTVPTTDTNNAAKSGNQSSSTPATQPTTTATPVTTMPGSKTDTPNDPMKPGSLDQGKTLFVTKCAKCHAIKNPGDYTADRWNEILKVMSPRAKLNNDEETALTAYLLANAKR